MRMIRIFRFGHVLLFLAFSIGATGAQAASNCDGFGQAAANYARYNIENNCGFVGGAWADDKEGHANWCRQPTVTDAQIAQILQDRQAMLNQCLASKPKVMNDPQACANYANSAILKARESRRLGCGYEGNSAYDDNYDGHYRWCLEQPVDNVVAQNQATNIGIDQCREAKLSGVCAFYATAMAPLYQQHNEACAGREDFVLTVSNPVADRQQCLENTAPDAAWVNAQVGQMQARIATCQANTITYSNPGDRGVPLDACTNDLGAFCGEWVAEDFCEWKGHSDVVAFTPGSTDFTVHVDCMMTGNVAAADQSQECYCSGNCGSITAITCTGRK